MKRLGVLILIVLAILFLILTKNRNGNITKTTEVKEIEYSAWIANWDETRSISSLNSDAGNKLTEILPVWYKIDNSGNVIEISSENKGIITEIARQKKIKVTPTIVNTDSLGFNPKLATKLFNQKNKVIDFLVKTAIENDYNGWDLDLEEVTQSDRNNYSQFTKELAKKLHKNGLTLSITVHAQNDNEKWEGTEGQDLRELSKNADYIRVMTYDFHNSDSEAGPITPLEDLKSTIDFIKSQVEISKIIIALPTYGYDWQNGKKGIPHQFQEIKTLIDIKKAENFRDLDSYELKATYEDHEIWYLDSASISKLIDITRSNGIYNICFWRLGGEDETLWSKI